MTEQDIQAWEREINHAAKMQEQREGWENKKPPFDAAATIPFSTYSAKDNSNDK